MKNYNHEVERYMDLRYRYVNIHCHGSYGVNPNVVMITRESYMREAFVKDFVVESKDDKDKQYLILISEYGQEVKLPLDKVISITVLSSGEQQLIETYIRHKEDYETTINQFESMIADLPTDSKDYQILQESTNAIKSSLERGAELVANGVKTYK